MNASHMPLVGALALAVALTANYFLAFSRMDINRPQGKRLATPRRQLVACAAAAVLPLIGALLPLSQADRNWTADDAAMLAWACGAIGLVLHLLMDKLMTWGTPVTTR